ncbi:hypothetical protein HK101_010331 [Irineochytrium annulatum]|nr:hypothetical protein HK101_010331 [Irineochytrium annulatum]
MLVPFNQAFVMLMSNLVCSWEKLYVREKGAKRWPVVFWPMDRISYEWAVGRGLEPILHNKSSYGVMEYAGFEKGKSEGDPGYLRMVRQRSKLIRRIVHDLGYNLFVLDSDSVLLKDPMSLLKWDSTLEIQIDGWDEDFVDIPQLPAPQGPAEIRGKEMTSAEKRAAALAGPAKAPTLSYFRPESSWPHDSAPAGSAGAFFLQANAAGRQLALHLDLLLTSQPTFDDTKALNLLARDYAWYRNLSPSSLSATSPAGSNATKTSLDISGRYFTVRFMGEEAVNGPVFFGPRRKRWDALRENGTVPTPAFVHANGTPNKRWAMRDAGVWLLNGQGDCPEEEKPGGPFNFSKPVQ